MKNDNWHQKNISLWHSASINIKSISISVRSRVAPPQQAKLVGGADGGDGQFVVAAMWAAKRVACSSRQRQRVSVTWRLRRAAPSCQPFGYVCGLSPLITCLSSQTRAARLRIASAPVTPHQHIKRCKRA